MHETKRVEFNNREVTQRVCGVKNQNLKFLERVLQIEIGVRDLELTIVGAPPDISAAANVLDQAYLLATKGYDLGFADFKRAVDLLARNPKADIGDIFLDTVFRGANHTIRPKGVNQKKYVDLIRKNDVVFGIGPAGTGKTYLAMAMALSQLVDKKVKRIILTRPAVEAGEKLGFLPGDLQEKVNPYLRPLYDAIFDMMTRERATELFENETIEIAPLAFMRGRTLNDAFIILDEAQNATKAQMKMLLTRIGQGSKAVITGDVTQVDLPHHGESGLIHATILLGKLKGIGFVQFEAADVVRHALVQKIINAYERDDQARIAKHRAQER